MSLFRSAEMKYYEMYIPKEDTYDVISKLATHSFVQFLDAAANNFQKPYYNSIKRCEEVLNRIDAILREAKQQKIQLPEIPIADLVYKRHDEIINNRKVTALARLDQMEDEIIKKYAGINKLSKSLTEFHSKILQLNDYKYLLFKARQIFGNNNNKNKEDKAGEPMEFSKAVLEQLRLVNVSGIVAAKDSMQFQKMIFRATKGNSILYTFNIPNDDDKAQSRLAFIAIIDSGQNILTKVNRICDSFNSQKYRLPTSKDEIFDKIKQIQDAITDTKNLVLMGQRKMREDLQGVISTAEYGFCLFQSYGILLERQLLIFNTMNMLDAQMNCMIAKIWIPMQKRGLLFRIIPSYVNLKEADPEGKPPTHFELNSFTYPFQQIISTYGTPRYQEINPAIFAIPIFPFLFGVMFGDIGHGAVLLAFGIWLVFGETPKQILPAIHTARYLVLMMGIFSFYAGWIYNEFFSIPLNLFGSCYGHAEPEEYAQKIVGCVYPIGFDPKWIRTSNQLNYFNSYKMKFAVIIGVLQMTFAIFLKMLNTLHFKLYLDFFFEWLPQQIFFACTFGYMIVLIIFKWTIAWDLERDTSTAPSIIGQMIALPLKIGSTEGKPLWNMQNQQQLQAILLYMSLICVPWMLISKPLILWFKMPSAPKAREQQYNDMQSHLYDDLDRPTRTKIAAVGTRQNTKVNDSHQEHDISEIVVHQIIETIEFVLGTISNTASYLRLWALSLAHGQLSKVFFQKTIGGGIQSANVIVIAIGMYFFFNITLGIIMGMDIMECFLHALRLQWVEFNNKFFKADGWKFSPLTQQNPIQSKAIALRSDDELKDSQ